MVYPDPSKIRVAVLPNSSHIFHVLVLKHYNLLLLGCWDIGDPVLLSLPLDTGGTGYPWLWPVRDSGCLFHCGRIAVRNLVSLMSISPACPLACFVGVDIVLRDVL